ncbi:Cytochrome b2, mitochondrial 4 [Phlyctema vagabunda]|uniref:Cytochrome b2, mitochondrial 4 n=1 Tax=Phlyctema vagabunda TaxID=108571 RepID=A0ABR4PLC6_9HELO
MKSSLIAVVASAITAVSAVKVFVNEPETGLEIALGADFPKGTLPALSDIYAIHDFDWAARNYLNDSAYAYYRTGAAGEWSYRNNLEVFGKVRAKPRALVGIGSIASSLTTTILGYNFSAPFFICPAARGALGNPEFAEAGLVKGAYAGDILYIPSNYATLSIEEIASNKPENDTQVTFQQIYLLANTTLMESNIRRAIAVGAKALVLSIDASAAATRHRAARFDAGSANDDILDFTWDIYDQVVKMSSVPVVPKGILTASDVRVAIQHGAQAVHISNHGGRQIDGSPSPLEVCLEIYEEDPTIFQQTEIWADGGVRYGTDVLKLLALGVKAVGMGRPFMYANSYGEAGVKKLIDIMKSEITGDAGNLGIANIHNISVDHFNYKPLTLNGF